MPGVLRSEPDAKLPACCRRDGKHGCSMNRKASQPQDTASFDRQQARATCPAFPAGKSTPVGVVTGELAPVYRIAGPAIQRSAALEQTEAQYRVSFSRTRQKRGPPLA